MTTSVCIDLSHDQSWVVSDSKYCLWPIRALDVTQSWPVIGQCLLCCDNHVTDRGSSSSSGAGSWVATSLLPPTLVTGARGSESYVTIQTSYNSHFTWRVQEFIPLKKPQTVVWKVNLFCFLQRQNACKYLCDNIQLYSLSPFRLIWKFRTIFQRIILFDFFFKINFILL